MGTPIGSFAGWVSRVNSAYAVLASKIADKHNSDISSTTLSLEILNSKYIDDRAKIAEDLRAAGAALDLLSAEFKQYWANSMDVAAPSVQGGIPGDGVTGVLANADLTFYFTEEMNPTTITSATLTLVNSAGASAGLTASSNPTTSDNKAFTLHFTAPLANSTRYKWKATTDITDFVGNYLPATYVSPIGFTSDQERVPPHVDSTSPASGAIGVLKDAAISVTFSEALAPATVTAASVLLVADGGGAADVTTNSVALSAGDTVATLTLSGNLTSEGVYRIKVTTAVTDVAGNPLATEYLLAEGFTVIDYIAPTVTATSPTNSATDVALSPTITVTFSEEMDAAEVTETTVYLVAGGGGAADVATTDVTLDATDRIATLVMAGPLTAETVYKIRVATGVTDLAGNHLASQYTQANGFTVVETTAPTVDHTDPANGASAVAHNVTISVTFVEAMDPATINENSIYLLNSGGGAADVDTISVAMSAGNTIATLTMAGDLTAETVYKINVTTDVTDAHGNHLASQYTQANGFTTAA